LGPQEIAIFVRSSDQLERARGALQKSDEPSLQRSVNIGTMHDAKGLEFRAVAVIACDDDVLPLQERIDAIADENDLEEVYISERHLLYVACTRAREMLWVSGAMPGSEFLEDLAE